MPSPDERPHAVIIGSGSASFEMLRYLDEKMTTLILGSLLPSGGGGDVGSNAQLGGAFYVPGGLRFESGPANLPNVIAD